MTFVFRTEFTASQRTHAHAGGAAVVRGEDDECIRVEFELTQRREHAAHAGVDLLDSRTIYVAFGSLENLRTGVSGPVDVGMRQIEKERIVPMILYELDGFLGDDFRQQGLISAVAHVSDRLVLTDDRQRRVGAAISDGIPAFVPRPHIIRIRDAKILIEALRQRQEFRLIPEVPLAKTAGGIALGLEELGDGDFVRMEAACFAGEEDGSIHADAVRVGPSH